MDTMVVYDAYEVGEPGSRSFRTLMHSSIDEEWIPGDWVEYNFFLTVLEYINDDCHGNPDCSCLRLERIKTRPLDFVGEGLVGLFPHVDEAYLFSGGGGPVQNHQIADSILLENGNSVSATKYTVETCVTEYNDSVDFLYSRNIGIVVKENFTKNERWVLSEYFIQQ